MFRSTCSFFSNTRMSMVGLFSSTNESSRISIIKSSSSSTMLSKWPAVSNSRCRPRNGSSLACRHRKPRCKRAICTGTCKMKKWNTQ